MQRDQVGNSFQDLSNLGYTFLQKRKMCLPSRHITQRLLNVVSTSI